LFDVVGEHAGAQEKGREIRGDLPPSTTDKSPIDDGVTASSILSTASPAGARLATPSSFLMNTAPQLQREWCWSWPANTSAASKPLMGPSRSAIAPPALPFARSVCCVPSPWRPVGFAAAAQAPRRPSPRLPQSQRRPSAKGTLESFEIGYAPIAGTGLARPSHPGGKPHRPELLEAAGWLVSR